MPDSWVDNSSRLSKYRAMLNDDVIARLKAVDPDRYRSALFADKPARAKTIDAIRFSRGASESP